MKTKEEVWNCVDTLWEAGLITRGEKEKIRKKFKEALWLTEGIMID